MTTEILLAKALTLDSEEEAIAHLRMARKRASPDAKADAEKKAKRPPPNPEVDVWKARAQQYYDGSQQWRNLAMRWKEDALSTEQRRQEARKRAVEAEGSAHARGLMLAFIIPMLIVAIIM